MTKRLTEYERRVREKNRNILKRRALGMRQEGVRIVDVCAELHISTHQLKRWEGEAKGCKSNVTPRPTATGYRWLYDARDFI